MKIENATLQQKVNYARGRAYAAGCRLVSAGMFYRVMDSNDKILKVGTIDAVIDWLNDRKRKS